MYEPAPSSVWKSPQAVPVTQTFSDSTSFCAGSSELEGLMVVAGEDVASDNSLRLRTAGPAP